MNTRRQKRAPRDGTLDAGLPHPTVDQPGLTTRTVSADPLVVALPAGHRLAGRGRLAPADLAGEDFIFHARDSGPSVHDRLAGHCLATGFAPTNTAGHAGREWRWSRWACWSCVASVAAGLGVCC